MRPAVVPLLLLILLPPSAAAKPCVANEILLRNQTCYCPFLKFNGLCMRRRFQTTFNATLETLYSASRHLLLSEQPLLLTVDASNEEAMRALAEALGNVRSVGTVVTRVVDATDILVGGDASATLELTNVTTDAESQMTLTLDCRFPPSDYFFLYMHLGTKTPPCPPFDAQNLCCHGRMGAAEFVAADGVDCTSHDPFEALDQFVGLWSGAYLSDDRQQMQLSLDLSRVPYTAEGNGARVYRVGVGMVVFGKLAQNTEARVELVLNSSTVATSFGSFQYSGIEYSRLQLEGCGGSVFAHLIVKARGIDSVQTLRFQTWDGGSWLAPNCSEGVAVWLGANRLSGCNVSLGDDFVDIYMALPPGPVNKTTTVYALLRRASVLTRVVAKTDDGILNHCSAPTIIDVMGHNAFTIRVAQGGEVKYEGPLQTVQLTDVAALTVAVLSRSPLYRYTLDNVSVVYSLVDSARILALMPDGQVTTELERLCNSGTVCLIEDLLLGGVCQTGEKCEAQGDATFLMPLYPWGGATLTNGTYTVMVAQIREELLEPPQSTSQHNATPLVRRLMQWLF
jgi:hypothetical protein